jgi:AcrR family transcriptional regulator
MREEFGSASEPGVLTPSVPRDIGTRSQRQRILESMAKSCEEKTFSTATIADIVGHASISRATFYKHFANKRECFYAATESFLADLQDAAAAAYSRDDSHTEAIRSLIRAVLERLAARPAEANLLLIEAPIVDPEIVRRCRNLVLDGMRAHPLAGKRMKPGGADPEIAFGRAKVLVTDYLAAGRVKELPSLLPELVYIALLPYEGQAMALEQAKIGR